MCLSIKREAFFIPVECLLNNLHRLHSFTSRGNFLLQQRADRERERLWKTWLLAIIPAGKGGATQPVFSIILLLAGQSVDRSLVPVFLYLNVSRA